jgi:ribosome biogenesis GTPase
VLFTSAARGEGVAELREALHGRRSVLCGPSGVGKSSLLNAVAPGLSLRVGEIGDVTHKGRHTTSGVTLLELPFGGQVADTAGLRQFGFWEVPPEQVGAGFPDLETYLGGCQYSNCSHRREQGCAVQEAVRAGAVDARRVRSYLQLAGGST